MSTDNDTHKVESEATKSEEITINRSRRASNNGTQLSVPETLLTVSPGDYNGYRGGYKDFVYRSADNRPITH